jgi:hypothetical protein
MINTSDLTPATITIIDVGLQYVIIASGEFSGGIVTNPYNAIEPLFIDLVHNATVVENQTCFPIQPGQTYTLPEGFVGNVSVNAITAGHKFSAIFWTSTYLIPYPPQPDGATFPPSEPNGLIKNLPSYIYQQYSDDDNIQAFALAQNELQQAFLNWFLSLNLPIYTKDPVSGALLDWVASGLYGFLRPVLTSEKFRGVGAFNTYTFNRIPINSTVKIGPEQFELVNDDIFRRIITWHFYKGDGKYFNIRWLKRRIMQFCIGVDGIWINPADTHQIGVSFGVGNTAEITIYLEEVSLKRSSALNTGVFNSYAYNSYQLNITHLPPVPNSDVFKEAVDEGILELPFSLTWTVHIEGTSTRRTSTYRSLG